MTTRNRRRTGRRNARGKRAREGAVMVEAVIVITALTAFFAWSLYMHRLAAAKLDSVYSARREAWKEGLAGCGSDGGFDIKSLVTSFSNDENTDVDGFFATGKRVSKQDSRQVTASRPLSVTGNIKSMTVFPCTIVPPRSDPIGDPSGWVFDLFM
jgi:hypothetical protein